MASQLKRQTATGLVAGGKRQLKGVLLEGGATASTVAIDDSAAGGGPVLLRLAAAAGTSERRKAADREGVLVSAGIYATLTGTGAGVTVELA